jgi:hypothetical protein
MSDQPGIPAITVFPPFNPAPRQTEPVREQAIDQAPAVAPLPAEVPAAPAAEMDAVAPVTPMPWDFEASAPASEPAPASGSAAPAEAAVEDDEDEDEDPLRPRVSEDEDLPWLEVPVPRSPVGEESSEIKADDTPNFADWMRNVGEVGGSEPAEEPTPVADLAPDEAAWDEGETAAGSDWAPGSPEAPWQPPAPEGAEPWQAADDAPAVPELYDLPAVEPPSAEPVLNENGEPAWEIPSQPAESGSVADAAALAAAAERLQDIADRLRADPGAVIGAQGAGDPLAQLVAGFVLGYQAREKQG